VIASRVATGKSASFERVREQRIASRSFRTTELKQGRIRPASNVCCSNLDEVWDDQFAAGPSSLKAERNVILRSQ
jgi:hypothetical protein